MESERIAKVVMLSSLITLLVIGGVIFAARDHIISYIKTEVNGSIAARKEEFTTVTAKNIVDTVGEVNPAVVSVVITKEVPVYEQYYESFDPGGFFGGFSIPRVRENGTEEKEVGGGSGFFVSNDGLIVTNRHVVEDKSASYSVLLNDGTSYNVEVLARDPQLDIAILKVSEPLKEAISYISFGDSDNVRLGETVIAIGNA